MDSCGNYCLLVGRKRAHSDKQAATLHSIQPTWFMTCLQDALCLFPVISTFTLITIFSCVKSLSLNGQCVYTEQFLLAASCVLPKNGVEQCLEQL